MLSQQAVTNLVVNALHACSPKGHVSFSSGHVTRPKPGETELRTWTTLAVADDGVALTRYDELGVDDLPEKVVAHRPTRVVLDAEDPSELITLEALEKRYALKVLDALKGNKTQAARTLGIERKTLYRKLEAWGRPDGDVEPG